MQTLLPESQMAQQSGRRLVLTVAEGFDAVQSHPVESIVQYCLDCFAAVPLLPEGRTQTVSQFRPLVHQVLDRQAHPADDIAMALAGDRPVQTVGIMVFPCPACHHLFGDERIAVGTPFEIGGYAGITAPVAEGTFPVPFGKPPQPPPFWKQRPPAAN